MFGIVIPNRYEDVIAPLVDSIKKYIPNLPPIIIVSDGHRNGYGFMALPYDDPEHFAFARAVNIGIRYLQGMDVILVNDDCVVLEENFFSNLSRLAYVHDKCGILSPLIVGCVGNPIQRFHDKGRYWAPEVDFMEVIDPYAVCFPCVYIKRSMLDQIGLMNESIGKYGFDDLDLCYRAREAGWKTVVTQRVSIQHGDGSADLGEGRGRSWSTSFWRRYPGVGGPTQASVEAYWRRHNK